MTNPQSMTDSEYIVHLEDINKALSDALHSMEHDCEKMLMEKDRALLEKCRKCRMG